MLGMNIKRPLTICLDLKVIFYPYPNNYGNGIAMNRTQRAKLDIHIFMLMLTLIVSPNIRPLY